MHDLEIGFEIVESHVRDLPFGLLVGGQALCRIFIKKFVVISCAKGLVETYVLESCLGSIEAHYQQHSGHFRRSSIS